MTSWMKERDRLVEQTLAFVKGVAAQRPVAAPINDARPVSDPSIPLASAITPDSDAVETILPALPEVLAQQPDAMILAAEPIAMANETLPLRVTTMPPIHQPALKRPAAVLLPERDVITQRVARFRAGQQKLLQDREDNYAILQARIRASLRNDPAGNDPIG